MQSLRMQGLEWLSQYMIQYKTSLYMSAAKTHLVVDLAPSAGFRSYTSYPASVFPPSLPSSQRVIQTSAILICKVLFDNEGIIRAKVFSSAVF